MQSTLRSRFTAPRDFLYVTALPQERLIHDLAAAGWRPIVADGIHRVSSICRARDDLLVGLVDLDDATVRSGFLPKLVGVSGLGFKWVALVALEHLESTNLRGAIGRYCFDFATLPVPVERLVVTLGRAWGMATLWRGQTGSSNARESDSEIIGVSGAIEKTRHSVSVFAATDAPVLIVGEAGTGKELAAKAIHVRSERRDGPVIAVNCGALPANLVHSELCGYEQGACTGADRRHIGKLEAASTGTIFLDEIGELPPLMQVKLLRVLQEHRIQRVGGSDDIDLDLRVIAATNVDLDQAVQKGSFREDLFYRLNVLPLRIPPLRERVEDIEPLAEHIFQTHIHERLRLVKGFSPEALTAMRSHRWPGNVRELINRVRRALLVSEGSLISPKELGLEQVAGAGVCTLDGARSRAERETLERAFEVSSGNVSEAARRLGITRNTLYRLIQKHRLDPRAVDSPISGPDTSTEGPNGALRTWSFYRPHGAS